MDVTQIPADAALTTTVTEYGIAFPGPDGKPAVDMMTSRSGREDVFGDYALQHGRENIARVARTKVITSVPREWMPEPEPGPALADCEICGTRTKVESYWDDRTDEYSDPCIPIQACRSCAARNSAHFTKAAG